MKFLQAYATDDAVLTVKVQDNEFYDVILMIRFSYSLWRELWVTHLKVVLLKQSR